MVENAGTRGSLVIEQCWGLMVTAVSQAVACSPPRIGKRETMIAVSNPPGVLAPYLIQLVLSGSRLTSIWL